MRPSLTKEPSDTVSDDGAAQLDTTREDSVEQSEHEGEALAEQAELTDSAAVDGSLAQQNELERLWLEALKDDRQYKDAKQAIVN